MVQRFDVIELDPGAALAHKSVVEGEDSLRVFSFAVVAGKKRLES